MVSIYYNSLGVTRDRGVENPFPWQLIIIVVALTIVFVTSFILNQRHKAESKEVKHSQDFFKKLADP